MATYLRPEGAQLRQGYPEAPAAQPREAHPLELLLAIMGDPRNSWMGGPGKIVHGAQELPALIGALGPLFAKGRGWEVLKEYMGKGGTPKTFRDILRKRGYPSDVTDLTSLLAKEGTDLAAPAYVRPTAAHAEHTNQRAAALRDRYPEATLPKQHNTTTEQMGRLESAARLLQEHEPNRFNGPPSALRTAGDLSRSREQLVDQGLEFAGETVPMIPSGVAGQGSYNAIASRMGRLMDDPNFLSLREHYLPPSVSDAAYYAELPIEGQALHEFYRQIPFDHVTIPPQFRQAPRSSLERMRTSDLNRRADVGEEGQH